MHLSHQSHQGASVVRLCHLTIKCLELTDCTHTEREKTPQRSKGDLALHMLLKVKGVHIFTRWQVAPRGGRVPGPFSHDRICVCVYCVCMCVSGMQLNLLQKLLYMICFGPLRFECIAIEDIAIGANKSRKSTEKVSFIYRGGRSLWAA